MNALKNEPLSLFRVYYRYHDGSESYSPVRAADADDARSRVAKNFPVNESTKITCVEYAGIAD